MTRNRERRSFTVAAKSSGHQGFVSIPAKAPRVPQAAANKPSTPDFWRAPSEPAAAPAVEPRRILPNLIAWEAPPPEPELAPEPLLPRIRRVTQDGVVDAPRRRGRPRKLPLAIETTTPATLMRKPEPALVLSEPRIETPAPVAATKPAQRRPRPESGSLRLGERWKRRLPRSCW